MPAVDPDRPKSAPQRALEKLGLRRPIDLALHLPMRYEDETRIVRLRDARDGDTVQIEGEVTHQEVTFRPRRQLLVSVNDGSDTVVLRFFNFYPSQQKQMAVGSQQIVGSVNKIDKLSKDAAGQAQNVSAATEEQSASMEEIASSSQALAKLAGDLQEMINQFRV